MSSETTAKEDMETNVDHMTSSSSNGNSSGGVMDQKERRERRSSSRTTRRKRSSGGKGLGANDFYVGDVLGEGAFSKVIHVMQKKSGGDGNGKACPEYAMKIVEKKFVEKHRKTAVVMMERNCLMRLNHPNIVKLHAAFRNKRFLFFALDLCQKGNLLDAIVLFRDEHKSRGRDHRAIGLPQTKFYVLELIAVLEYMHSQDIIHRDLKPENVLLKDDGHLMLADFGTAKDERSKRKCNTFCGTAEYVSPEVLRDEEATRAADYWAVGCILFQLCFGTPPFRGAHDMATFELITRHVPEDGKRQFTLPRDDVPHLLSVLDGIFVQDPKKRLCGPTLRAHPFFWDNLNRRDDSAVKGTTRSAASSVSTHNVWVLRSRLGERISSEPSSIDTIATVVLGFLCTVDVQRDVLEARAPDMHPTLEARKKPFELNDSGTLEDFELVLAQREMNEVVLASKEGDLHEIDSKLSIQSPDSASPHVDAWVEHLETGESVVLSGLVVKKRYRFTDISSKFRHLILTDKPRIIYLDPENNAKRGEIPWSQDMEVILKLDQPGSFDIQTPHRTYLLRDVLGDANRWQNAIYKALGKPASPKRAESPLHNASSSGFFFHFSGS